MISLSLTQYLSPTLAALLIVTVGWFVRARASAKAHRRLLQLREAAELLDAHARALERFLHDHDSPASLKRLLIACSDAAVDREMVGKLMAWAACHPLDQPVDTEEARSVREALAGLGARRPDLVEAFSVAVMTAVAGGSLHWPESADMADWALPRLAATPGRDVAVAVTAARLRSDAPFSVRRAAPLPA